MRESCNCAHQEVSRVPFDFVHHLRRSLLIFDTFPSAVCCVSIETAVTGFESDVEVNMNKKKTQTWRYRGAKRLSSEQSLKDN